MSRTRLVLSTSCAVMLLSACAADDPHRRAKAGAAIGTVTGAVIGHQTSSKNGKYAGAAIGALTGAAIGHYLDRQQQQLEQELAREVASKDIRLVRLDDKTLKIELNSEATFDVNSAAIRSQFRSTLATVAAVIAEYDQTAVHVIGHTDNTGSIGYNQQLSERRAQSVGQELNRQDVARSRLRMSGRGEKQPLADNRSKRGRSQNRRVEIYLKPIEQGRESEAWTPPA